jgi:SAM-dependent methyltransferase
MAELAPVLFGITILVSACLLFLVQPLSSKLILPWFGGSAAVWITCLLFFQTGLLLGYLYAHALTRHFHPKYQAIVHATLLLLSLAALPILPNPLWEPKPGEDPTWRVFGVLATSVGFPYVLLSSTTPLLQSWFASRKLGALPYRYFALSNAGSLVALLAYPVLIEPYLNGHRQAFLWSAAFVLFTLLCIATALTTAHSLKAALPNAGRQEVRKPPILITIFWISLAACASALLLTVTNLLTQNIAPMPLLWVLPLSIYLLTFILCFESDRWYKRLLFVPLVLPALWFLASTTGTMDSDKIKVTVPVIALALFICCMACHGELVRLKPGAEHLTAFYLSLSAGGALGGLFVALFAPHVFRAMYEYPICYVSCALLLLLVFWRERLGWRKPQVALSIWLAAAAAAIALSGYASRQTWREIRGANYLNRNFYGALRVIDFADGKRMVRELSHGTITHGMQILDSRLRHLPTTYYGRDSGIGLTWRALESQGPLRMGVVGLGAGTLAAYGRAGDTLRFYDINPLVVGIARTKFTFLADCRAHIDIVLGDARLSMAQEPIQRFDILVIDAFSGDAIPVHLLTREAFQIYWRHLKPDGVLAVHVSNHYLDLPPVVMLAAKEFGKPAWQVENDDEDSNEVYASTYVLVSSRPGFFQGTLMKGRLEPIAIPAYMRPWTDDFSNLWQVLKFGD